jgi:hypothetical protein
MFLCEGGVWNHRTYTNTQQRLRHWHKANTGTLTRTYIYIHTHTHTSSHIHAHTLSHTQKGPRARLSITLPLEWDDLIEQVAPMHQLQNLMRYFTLRHILFLFRQMVASVHNFMSFSRVFEWSRYHSFRNKERKLLCIVQLQLRLLMFWVCVCIFGMYVYLCPCLCLSCHWPGKASRLSRTRRKSWWCFRAWRSSVECALHPAERSPYTNKKTIDWVFCIAGWNYREFKQRNKSRNARIDPKMCVLIVLFVVTDLIFHCIADHQHKQTLGIHTHTYTHQHTHIHTHTYTHTHTMTQINTQTHTNTHTHTHVAPLALVVQLEFLFVDDLHRKLLPRFFVHASE